jgi:hypothetical protein
MLHRTLVAFAAAVALGCVPVATNALAAGHPSGHATARGSSGHAASRGGHVAGGYAGGYRGRYAGGRGPIYNSYGGDYTGCSGYSYGYGYGGCPGYGVPLVAGVINGVLGGYSPY